MSNIPPMGSLRPRPFYGCQCGCRCSEEETYPADMLRWSPTRFEWVCENCHEQHDYPKQATGELWSNLVTLDKFQRDLDQQIERSKTE